jgi:hypothetical protein
MLWKALSVRAFVALTTDGSLSSFIPFSMFCPLVAHTSSPSPTSLTIFLGIYIHAYQMCPLYQITQLHSSFLATMHLQVLR